MDGYTPEQMQAGIDLRDAFDAYQRAKQALEAPEEGKETDVVLNYLIARSKFWEARHNAEMAFAALMP